MKLREAIEKLTMWHQANPRTGPLGVVMDATIDGTLIPADQCYEVREGYEVGAAKVDADGNLQRIAELSEALEIRSADDVRREARVWQPIETAPKDGTSVLVYVTDSALVTEAWFCSETGLWPHDNPYTDELEPCNVGLPTHWMPLPEPPKGGDDE